MFKIFKSSLKSFDLDKQKISLGFPEIMGFHFSTSSSRKTLKYFWRLWRKLAQPCLTVKYVTLHGKIQI